MFCLVSSIHQPVVYSQWQVISTINTTELTCVKFFDVNTGLTCGIGGIWRTTNSGINWTKVLNTSKLNSISFYNNDIGYSVGDSGKVYRTTNNGLDWIFLSSGLTQNLLSVAFPGMNTGYAVGQGGIILRTSTSGSSWVTQLTFGSDFYNIKMRNGSTGYVVGSSTNEVFFSTANGGTNWLTPFNNSGPSLRSVEAIGISTVIAVGNNGRIRKSTNNGVNWTLPASNTTFQLNSIFFTDQTTGYICGNSGKILTSTNAGGNWTSQNSNTQLNLTYLSFINSNTGWVVGQNGIVMNIGLPVIINPISLNEPKELELYQNYPNPFNSSTKIKFLIPRNSNKQMSDIRLIIFDVLGRVVTILVNELLKPGIYNVVWNATSLSSGVYFYKLEYGNTSQTQKLILIK